MKNIKIIILLAVLFILFFNCNCFSRTVRKPNIIEQFIKSKEEDTPNEMVEEIMSSKRGEKLVQDLKEKFKKADINNLSLPFEINDMQVPAGHGYEYKVSIIIRKTTNTISISSITGDLELEGESEDPSCWNRLKVITRCVIAALEKCGMQIHKELNQALLTPYYYIYYYEKP